MQSSSNMKADVIDDGVMCSLPGSDYYKTPLKPRMVLCFVGLTIMTALTSYVDSWSTIVPVAILTIIAAFPRLLLPAAIYEWLYIFAKTCRRDFAGLIILIRLKWTMSQAVRNNVTVPKHFETIAHKYPNKPCIIIDEQSWTFRQVEEHSNRVANVFYDAGYRKGDIVCLLMENCPEFVCIWLGLSKIGVITAFINFNLREKPLLHSLKVANAKAVIFGADFADAVNGIRDEIPEDMQLYCSGKTVPSFAKSLDSALDSALTQDPPKVDLKMSDRLVFIYTSGTTGLPKPAVITHLRYVFMASSIRTSFGLRLDDILYDPLPLYHSAGCGLGLGQSILYGTTLVIRKKFSASRFWDDCIKHKCTASQYIGEMCRYLLAQPEKPQDKMHSVKLMYGNGLRPQSWQTFVDRFGIKQMGEFYGSTEGNANMVNLTNKVGSVGFFSRIAPSNVYPLTLIKLDDNGVPMRDSKGLCVQCNPGEPGELVGKISKKDPMRKFDGYVDKDSTSKKILCDVFQKGDVCFKTGDLMVMDYLGYVYFVDRRGDTFRWKGENVSTAEVEAVISNIVGLNDATVYGVQVPGAEGKAGMATIVDKSHTLDLGNLALDLEKSLPVYARPVFIRLMDSVPVTDTYKLKKVDLQKEGFDPSQCSNSRLYYHDGKKYSVLDEIMYREICSGQWKRI